MGKAERSGTGAEGKGESSEDTEERRIWKPTGTSRQFLPSRSQIPPGQEPENESEQKEKSTEM